MYRASTPYIACVFTIYPAENIAPESSLVQPSHTTSPNSPPNPEETSHDSNLHAKSSSYMPSSHLVLCSFHKPVHQSSAPLSTNTNTNTALAPATYTSTLLYLDTPRLPPYRGPQVCSFKSSIPRALFTSRLPERKRGGGIPASNTQTNKQHHHHQHHDGISPGASCRYQTASYVTLLLLFLPRFFFAPHPHPHPHPQPSPTPMLRPHVAPLINDNDRRLLLGSI